MNTLIENDINEFFKQQVFMRVDDDNVTIYKTLIYGNHKKIYKIHFYKLKDQYRIYSYKNDSYFTVNKGHEFYQRLFEHTVEFKMTGGNIKFEIHFLDENIKSPYLYSDWKVR